MIWVFFFLLFSSLPVSSLDTITLGQSIKGEETLVSSGGRFELGFHRPGNSTNHFLAIRYKIPSAFSVVCVANRETPIVDPPATLKITKQGLLVLLNAKNVAIWSSNKTGNFQSPILQLLDSGNLVVKHRNDGNNSDNFLWQSFDYPGNTFLPGVKIGRNFLTGQDRFLTSWKSAENPDRKFSLWIDPRGFPQLLLRNTTFMYYKLGPWNGLHFTETTQLPQGFLEY